MAKNVSIVCLHCLSGFELVDKAHLQVVLTWLKFLQVFRCFSLTERFLFPRFFPLWARAMWLELFQKRKAAYWTNKNPCNFGHTWKDIFAGVCWMAMYICGNLSGKTISELDHQRVCPLSRCLLGGLCWAPKIHALLRTIEHLCVLICTNR